MNLQAHNFVSIGGCTDFSALLMAHNQQHHAFMRLPAVAAASAPGVAASAPVPDVGAEPPANSTAGLVAQVWMTNWPVAVVPPWPETPPADPPTGLAEVRPKPCPTVASMRTFVCLCTTLAPLSHHSRTTKGVPEGLSGIKVHMPQNGKALVLLVSAPCVDVAYTQTCMLLWCMLNKAPYKALQLYVKTAYHPRRWR